MQKIAVKRKRKEKKRLAEEIENKGRQKAAYARKGEEISRQKRPQYEMSTRLMSAQCAESDIRTEYSCSKRVEV
jgi:hypothetical protein